MAGQSVLSCCCRSCIVPERIDRRFTQRHCSTGLEALAHTQLLLLAESYECYRQVRFPACIGMATAMLSRLTNPDRFHSLERHSIVPTAKRIS